MRKSKPSWDSTDKLARLVRRLESDWLLAMGSTAKTIRRNPEDSIVSTEDIRQIDIVRLGRELSVDLTAVGVSLVLGGGLLILLLWVRLWFFPITYESGLFIVTALFIGFTATVLGGIFWVAYRIDEYQEFRKLAPLLDRIDQSKTGDLSLSPAFLLDSIDRELLQIVKEAGGDILSVKNQMRNRVWPSTRRNRDRE